MKNIAIILARKGSKGIPNKNLVHIHGTSLLARTILVAKESGIFDSIVVSTDGESIAEEAKKYGAEVVIRPAELATDSASSISGVLHVLDCLELNTGVSCLLQPTSPLRQSKHIKEAYALFMNQRQGAVVSATMGEYHPYKLLIEENNHYYPVHNLRDLESPRQILPKAYRPNGAIYFNRVEDLIMQKCFFIEPINLYLMNKEDSIDIDHLSDLIIAEQYIAKKEQNHE